jgi:hypothetical protein
MAVEVAVPGFLGALDSVDAQIYTYGLASAYIDTLKSGLIIRLVSPWDE